MLLDVPDFYNQSIVFYLTIVHFASSSTAVQMLRATPWAWCQRKMGVCEQPWGMMSFYEESLPSNSTNVMLWAWKMRFSSPILSRYHNNLMLLSLQFHWMCILPFFSQYFVLPPVFSPPAWLFAPHLSCICLISTALLPEFLPAGSPLHTCRASPSLALPSLQCLYLHLIPSLIYVVFKSSLLFSHCRGICVVTVLLLFCFPDVP